MRLLRLLPLIATFFAADLFLVQTNEGYAVIEWNGHDNPNRNDRLADSFTAGAMHLLENTTKGGNVKV